MKHKPKYLSAKETEQKPSPRRWLIPVGVAALVVLAAAALLIWRNQPAKNIDSRLPTEETDPPITIVTDQIQQMPEKVTSVDTLHGPLQFDETYVQSLLHEEVTEDGVTMEVFSMIAGEQRWELFRICYGETAQGDLLGNLQTDGQLIPVRVRVCSYTLEDFPDEETYQMHLTLMDQLNVILAGIRSDSHFVVPGSQPAEKPQVQEAKAAYWTVELPEGITWEETTSEGHYRVDYYGTIGAKTVRLYTIALGDPNADSILGTYTTDQGTLSVGVYTYDHENQNAWEEESQYQEYTVLMETINDVIQAIMAQKQFSEAG